MDARELERLAALDPADREAYVEGLLGQVERVAPWQRPILRKRLEELRAACDASGDWDCPQRWIPGQR